MLKITVILLFLCAMNESVQFGRFGKACKPPRGDACVEIRKCPFFDELLNKTEKPRSKHVIRLIRQHECGFVGGVPEVPKVCCSRNAYQTSPFKVGKACKPPRGDTCVEIRKCPFFDELLNKTEKPRSKHVIRLIRQHECGFVGGVPKVCCFSNAVTSAKPVIPIERSYFPPPDVRNHESVGLLPNDVCGPLRFGRRRIAGGSETSPSEFPWMAQIAYDTGEGVEFRCGGTLIGKDHVLTAAHCAHNLTIVGVRLGEHDTDRKLDCGTSRTCSEPTQDVRPSRITVHPGYVAETLANDIALIALGSSANTFQENIQPICLPVGDPALENLDGKFATVCGWGSADGGLRSSVLLKSRVPIIPLETCRRTGEGYHYVDYNQICAGGFGGRDSCDGDSGGPLQTVALGYGGGLRYVQRGIVSFGPKRCGTDGRPGVYTNVAYYMDWILDGMRQT